MVKRLLNLKTETGRWLIVVQRFKLAFIREIWLPVRETGRFVLYPGDSWIIRESWHECNLYLANIVKRYETGTQIIYFLFCLDQPVLLLLETKAPRRTLKTGSFSVGKRGKSWEQSLPDVSWN